VIGEVGDSGNSDESHLHLQVQDKPTFDVEDRSIRTYPPLGRRHGLQCLPG
jgi:murein DD-endopeptidase MepM/ murein hydrolase activator NlpD